MLSRVAVLTAASASSHSSLSSAGRTRASLQQWRRLAGALWTCQRGVHTSDGAVQATARPSSLKATAVRKERPTITAPAFPATKAEPFSSFRREMQNAMDLLQLPTAGEPRVWRARCEKQLLQLLDAAVAHCAALKKQKHHQRQQQRQQLEEGLVTLSYQSAVSLATVAARLLASSPSSAAGSAPPEVSLLTSHAAYQHLVEAVSGCRRPELAVLPQQLRTAVEQLVAAGVGAGDALLLLLVNDVAWLVRRMPVLEVLKLLPLAVHLSDLASTAAAAAAAAPNSGSDQQLQLLAKAEPLPLDTWLSHTNASNHTASGPLSAAAAAAAVTQRVSVAVDESLAQQLPVTHTLLPLCVATVERRWLELNTPHHLLHLLGHSRLFSERLLRRAEDAIIDAVSTTTQQQQQLPCEQQQWQLVFTVSETVRLMESLAGTGRRPLSVLRSLAHHENCRFRQLAVTASGATEEEDDEARPHHHQQQEQEQEEHGMAVRQRSPDIVAHMSFSQCVRLLAAIQRLSFRDSVWLDQLATAVCRHLASKPLNNIDSHSAAAAATTVKHVVSLIIACGQMHWQCAPLWQAVTDWCLTNSSSCTPQLAAQLLHALATVNYEPPQWRRQLLPLLLLRLGTTSFSDPHHPQQQQRPLSATLWLNAVWSLTVLDSVTDQLLASVLCDSFCRQLLAETAAAGAAAGGGSASHAGQLRLLNLLAYALLYRQQQPTTTTSTAAAGAAAAAAGAAGAAAAGGGAGGDGRVVTLSDSMLAKLTGGVRVRVPRASSQLSERVLELLAGHVPASKCLRPPAAAPVPAVNVFGLYVDAEFCVRRDSGEPVSWRQAPASTLPHVEASCLKAAGRAVREAQKLAAGGCAGTVRGGGGSPLCPVAVRVWSHRDFSYPSYGRCSDVTVEPAGGATGDLHCAQYLLGHNVLSVRLLRALGFRVLQVPYWQVHGGSSPQLVDRLKQLVTS